MKNLVLKTVFASFLSFHLFAHATDGPLITRPAASLKPLRITMTEDFDKASEDFLSDIEQAFPYAQLTDAGYKFAIEQIPGYRRLEKEELPQEWQSYFVPKKEDAKYPLGKGMLINDKKNNMWATILESDKEIVLVLRGTELRPSYFSDMVGNFTTAIKHWWGNGIPKHYLRSFELAKALGNKYPGKELVITGSSLGGSLAMFAGLATGARVYAFNSLGLNANEISFIKGENKDAFLHANEKVRIINIVGDAIVDNASVLPGWFLNKYFGKLIMVPFYDNSWSGYYLSAHHTSDALVKSMEAYIKRSKLENGRATITPAHSPT
jgi:hypothetical protein